MSSTTFDAFMTPLHTSGVAILFVRAVGTTMWQIVVVAHTQIVTIHATETCQCLWNLHTIVVVPTSLVLLLGTRFLSLLGRSFRVIGAIGALLWRPGSLCGCIP